MNLLEGKRLSKRYTRGKNGVDALKDVSFTLGKGEILGVVGESGSGKSTLLRLISGLEPSDSGEILLEGRKLPEKRTREDYCKIQMIFQDAVGSFHLRRRIYASVIETANNLRGKTTVAELNELFERVGLSPGLAKRYPSGLSGGQCQRFAIARAVAVKPQILLCDEITSALDVSSQAQILKLLSKICHERDMSAIFVSHDLAVVSCICDRVVVMRNGRVIETGEVRRIIEAPSEEYTARLIDSVMEVH